MNASRPPTWVILLFLLWSFLVWTTTGWAQIGTEFTPVEPSVPSWQELPTSSGLWLMEKDGNVRAKPIAVVMVKGKPVNQQTNRTIKSRKGVRWMKQGVIYA